MTAPLADTDRIALHDLVHRYAARVDDRVFDSVAGLFTDDALLWMPEPPEHLDPVTCHHGREGIVTALSALSAIPLTQHGIHGTVFDAGTGPGTAVGRISGVAHHLTPDQRRADDLIWHLHYRDHYVRADGGWLFARRDTHIDFIVTGQARRYRTTAVHDRPEHDSPY